MLIILSNSSFEKYKKNMELHSLIDKLLEDNDDNYNVINDFLLSLSNSKWFRWKIWLTICIN